MARRSFSTSDERINWLEKLVEKGVYPDVSTCINESIDLNRRGIENKKSIEFMYFICIPLGLFLGCLGLSLHLASLFFYIVSVIFGFYLMIFVYLFYNKYRSVKYGNNNK